MSSPSDAVQTGWDPSTDPDAQAGAQLTSKGGITGTEYAVTVNVGGFDLADTSVVSFEATSDQVSKILLASRRMRFEPQLTTPLSSFLSRQDGLDYTGECESLMPRGESMDLTDTEHLPNLLLHLLRPRQVLSVLVSRALASGESDRLPRLLMSSVPLAWSSFRTAPDLSPWAAPQKEFLQLPLSFHLALPIDGLLQGNSMVNEAPQTSTFSILGCMETRILSRR